MGCGPQSQGCCGLPRDVPGCEGGPFRHEVPAARCDRKLLTRSDRRRDLGDPHEVTVWTGFDFPGRNGKHSTFRYNWRHFNGIDYEVRSNTRGIWRFIGDGKSGWAADVSDELGNYVRVKAVTLQPNLIWNLGLLDAGRCRFLPT